MRRSGKRGRTAGRPSWLDRKVLDPAIRDAVDGVRAVDVHEHLDEESARLKQPNNLSRFFMYYSFNDLSAAGLSPDAEKRFFSDELSGTEQWKLIREAWPKARNTAYCRAIRLSIERIYGIDDLRDDTIEPLLEAVDMRNRPGVVFDTLRRICNLECCLVNSFEENDLARRTETPGLFLFDMGVSPFCQDQLDLTPFEKASGINCESLRDWHRLLDFYFARWGRQAVALKNTCGYWRRLKFDDVPENRAAPLFEKWLVRKEEVTDAERRAVQDFMFHACIRRAIEFDLPVKIHTGYHAGTGYMDMELFRARDLANLFRQYPRARFDVFHIGYPYTGEVLALAKHYPNVYPDMCWTWIIDPQASLDFARRALGSLPDNKLLGFGGDYGFADVVYGHSRIARDGIALALTEAVRDGRLTRADAKTVARRWLRENAMELFRIEDRRASQAAGQPPPL